MPPTLQGHPDTLNPSCQFSRAPPGHTRRSRPCPAPHSPQKACGLQTAAGGWRGTQEEKTAGVSSDASVAKALQAGGIGGYASFPRLGKVKTTLVILPEALATASHTPKTTTTRQGWGAGSELLYLLVKGIGLPSSTAHHPTSQAVLPSRPYGGLSSPWPLRLRRGLPLPQASQGPGI